jgi:pyruvate formate lyase activating enzyme
MTEVAATTAAMLRHAARIGQDAGLRYVYAGNLPGRVGDLEDTCCHECGERLVVRLGYAIQQYKVTADGTCPSCRTPVPGRWSTGFEGQRTSRPFLPHDRTRLSVF